MRKTVEKNTIRQPDSRPGDEFEGFFPLLNMSNMSPWERGVLSVQSCIIQSYLPSSASIDPVCFVGANE